MAFIECVGGGGGASFDYSNPTVVKQGNMSAQGSLTAAVPSTPKLIIALRSRYNNSDGHCAFYVFDYTNKKGRYLVYNGSYAGGQIDSSNYTSWFASGGVDVTFYNNTNSPQRGQMMIWC